MAESDDSNVRVLDPVVVEALKSITRRVYHRRGPKLWDKFRRYYSMLDNESRDSTIAAFEHLRHGGYDFQPFLVRRWATANGWKKLDAQLLDDYAPQPRRPAMHPTQPPTVRQLVRRRRWSPDSLRAPTALADPPRSNAIGEKFLGDRGSTPRGRR